MSGKKIFQKDKSDSVTSHCRQRKFLHCRKILILLVLVISFLPNWGSVLPVSASAVTVLDVPPQINSVQINDFDGDGQSDFAIARKEPIPGTDHKQLIWYILRSSDQTPMYKWFGMDDDVIVSDDYDGDGVTDAAVYREGEWHVQNSSDGSYLGVQLGHTAALPAQADYDGDGKTDFAIYEPLSRKGTVIQSHNGEWVTYNFDCDRCRIGNGNDYAPAPADYDNDGKADFALIQDDDDANPRQLIIKKSSESLATPSIIWNLYMPAALFLVPEGDGRDPRIRRNFNRDERMDLAIVHNSGGLLYWMIFLDVGNNQEPTLTPNYTIQWGKCGDYPMVGDYQPNGLLDLAVWRPAEGNFYIRPTLNSNLDGGPMIVTHWGSQDDIPITPDGKVGCSN